MAEARPNPSLAAGWVALEAGRTDDAVAAGEAALATFPHDHAAVVLVVSALTAGGRVPRAVTAYQGRAGNHPGGDIHLLAIVARGVLTTLGREAPLLDQRVAALDVLSDCGDQAGPRSLACDRAAGRRARRRGARRTR